jgi:glycosyltransferase involved in cell wall biosynthesis
MACRSPISILPRSGKSSGLLKHGGRGGARHDIGLWTTAILREIFPRIRAVVREDPRSLPDHGLERLMDNLPQEDLVVIAPARYSWPRLLSIADLLLVTPDGPFAAGSVLHAIAARVPVIGTPVDAVKEHLATLQNGLLAASTKPREIAAAVEAFLSQPREKVPATALNGNGNGSIHTMLQTLYAGAPVSAWKLA